ncbi:MAG: aminotransferase class IV [Bacteroidia bacterium]|nr:aminotransferase class IV [Bacteroidia bacterium]
MSYILLNGHFVKQTGDVFGQDTRLWQFGEGLFESIRVFNGRSPLLDLHAARLSRSSKILGWAISPAWNERFWNQQIDKLCEKNQWTNARVKLIVYRQGAGTYLPENVFFNWILFGQELHSDEFELNPVGLRTMEFSRLPKPAEYLSLLKITSAMRYIQAAQFAFQNRVDEVLITNQFDRICEASSSNLFIVQGDSLITPALSEYCLDGVMRRAIISLAEMHGIECFESSVFKNDVYYADELFVTNAVKGIQWIGSYEDCNFELGKLTKKFHKWLNELLQE